MKAIKLILILAIAEVAGMLTGKRGSDVRIKVERNGRVSEMDILLDGCTENYPLCR